MSDGMGREFTYLSSHATNRYFIPNWGKFCEIIGDCVTFQLLSENTDYTFFLKDGTVKYGVITSKATVNTAHYFFLSISVKFL